MHQDSKDTLGNLEVEVIPTLIVRACDGLSWNTPAGLNLSESRARGYVATWRFIISGCREPQTKSN